jgi:hypothetical protein
MRKDEAAVCLSFSLFTEGIRHLHFVLQLSGGIGRSSVFMSNGTLSPVEANRLLFSSVGHKDIIVGFLIWSSPQPLYPHNSRSSSRQTNNSKERDGLFRRPT